MLENNQQAGDGGAGAGNNGEGGEGGGETPTLAQLQAELAELKKANKVKNAESATWRKKLDEIEAAEKDRQDKELGEAESAKRKASEMEAKLKAMADRHRTASISAAIRLAAAAADFADPSDAVALADLSAVTLDDDTDQVTGAKEAVAALAKAKPHLIKQASTTGGDINARERGRSTAPTIDEVIAQKRATDSMYIPL